MAGLGLLLWPKLPPKRLIRIAFVRSVPGKEASWFLAKAPFSAYLLGKFCFKLEKMCLLFFPPFSSQWPKMAVFAFQKQKGRQKTRPPPNFSGGPNCRVLGGAKKFMLKMFMCPLSRAACKWMPWGNDDGMTSLLQAAPVKSEKQRMAKAEKQRMMQAKESMSDSKSAAS